MTGFARPCAVLFRLNAKNRYIPVSFTRRGHSQWRPEQARARTDFRHPPVEILWSAFSDTSPRIEAWTAIGRYRFNILRLGSFVETYSKDSSPTYLINLPVPDEEHPTAPKMSRVLRRIRRGSPPDLVCLRGV